MSYLVCSSHTPGRKHICTLWCSRTIALVYCPSGWRFFLCVPGSTRRSPKLKHPALRMVGETFRVTTPGGRTLPVVPCSVIPARLLAFSIPSTAVWEHGLQTYSSNYSPYTELLSSSPSAVASTALPLCGQSQAAACWQKQYYVPLVLDESQFNTVMEVLLRRPV